MSNESTNEVSDASPRRADLATLFGRSAMPAEIRSAGGMRKLNWILSLPDPGGWIRDLASGEFYLLTKDIGAADSGALMELASLDQLQWVQDLDIWSKDEVRFDRWIGWLELARSASIDAALRFLQATDSELYLRLLTSRITVHDKDLDLDMVSDHLQALQTPDFMYWVTIPHEDAISEDLPMILKLLWAADTDRLRTIFQAALFELPSAVSTIQGRLRGGRLLDMGFYPPAEALEVYTYEAPGPAREQARTALTQDEPCPLSSHVGSSQDLLLTDVEAPDLLGAVISALEPDRRASFAESMSALVGKVFMAETGDLSLTAHLPDAGRRAARLTNLGLAWLADESVDRATRLIDLMGAEHFFRVGYSLAFDLARRARRIRRRAGVAQGLSLFGAPTDSVLEGVAAARPVYFDGIDDEGGTSWRDFATQAEICRVEVLLDDADAVLSFFEDRLGFSPQALLEASLGGLSDDQRRELRLATLFRTGLIQSLLSDEFLFQPLSREELAAFLKVGFDQEGGHVRPSKQLQEALDHLATQMPESVERWARGALGDLGLALGRVQTHDLDPRYASELVLVQEQTA
jgi:hypothetical protein